MKKARLDRGLLQRDVAGLLGVDTATVASWEQGRTVPLKETQSAMMEFIASGVVNRSRAHPPADIGVWLKQRRQELGLSLERAAARVGTRASNLHDWECGRWRPRMSWWPAIVGFLGYDPLSRR